jgi:HSP20 family molecular chaperone IbpA
MPKNATTNAIERASPARASTPQPLPQTKSGSVTYRPPLDLFDLGDRYELRVDLPGASPEAIDLTVQDDTLRIEATVPWRYPDQARVIQAEFGVGNFRRELRIGEDIDADKLSADYTLGVLIVTLPKLPDRQPRKIQVRAG